MAWVLIMGIVFAVGFIIYRRKKGPARQIQDSVSKQMKELDEVGIPFTPVPHSRQVKMKYDFLPQTSFIPII